MPLRLASTLTWDRLLLGNDVRGPCFAIVLFSHSIVRGDVYLGSAYEPFDYPAGASLFDLNGGIGFNAFGDNEAPNSFDGAAPAYPDRAETLLS